MEIVGDYVVSPRLVQVAGQSCAPWLVGYKVRSILPAPARPRISSHSGNQAVRRIGHHYSVGLVVVWGGDGPSAPASTSGTGC
jgi:hypothetical protein